MLTADAIKHQYRKTTATEVWHEHNTACSNRVYSLSLYVLNPGWGVARQTVLSYRKGTRRFKASWSFSEKMLPLSFTWAVVCITFVFFAYYVHLCLFYVFGIC